MNGLPCPGAEGCAFLRVGLDRCRGDVQAVCEVDEREP